MFEIAISKNNVQIRLFGERWVHIIKGYRDAKIALRVIKKQKFLAVVYKELSKKEGFVITAYFSTKIHLSKEKILWQRK
ncbi:MAG: hypothetical protein QME52_09405 [Bacteroidota bacterium]|nr:hypothetical protein [Bacteroidota bacterium]